MAEWHFIDFYALDLGEPFPISDTRIRVRWLLDEAAQHFPKDWRRWDFDEDTISFLFNESKRRKTSLNALLGQERVNC